MLRFRLCQAIANPRFCRPAGPAPRSRFQKANGLFANENLDFLSHLLDDWFRVPGTSIRFGLDGIIGLVPGLGDILGGLASTIIVVAAWVRGVPYVTLLRMVVNIGIEVLLGAIPLLGDAFDIAWKANRRNYALIVRHWSRIAPTDLARLGLSAADCRDAGCHLFGPDLPDSLVPGVAWPPSLTVLVAIQSENRGVA